MLVVPGGVFCALLCVFVVFGCIVWWFRFSLVVSGGGFRRTFCLILCVMLCSSWVLFMAGLGGVSGVICCVILCVIWGCVLVWFMFCWLYMGVVVRVIFE